MAAWAPKCPMRRRVAAALQVAIKSTPGRGAHCPWAPPGDCWHYGSDRALQDGTASKKPSLKVSWVPSLPSALMTKISSSPSRVLGTQ
jgi:hypothetical protein